MKSLENRIAIVTGASRGVGKGIAVGLGEAGATVYVTGRTIEEGKAAVQLPGTIQQTADEINAIGGTGIAVQCDHTDDQQVRALIDRVMNDHGRIDILVNNVWGGYEFFNDGTEFWKEKGFWTTPLSRWDLSFAAGVRAHYVASVFTVPHMIAQKSGLIVNVSSLAADEVIHGVAYSTAKMADVKMAECMAHELRAHNVAAIALHPGLVRTEAIMKAKQFFDISNSESPQFLGRAVAALASDPNLMSKSGKALVAAEIAMEYGFSDIDGKQPNSLRK